jgi:hypothetical protein
MLCWSAEAILADAHVKQSSSIALEDVKDLSVERLERIGGSGGNVMSIYSEGNREPFDSDSSMGRISIQIGLIS